MADSTYSDSPRRSAELGTAMGKNKKPKKTVSFILRPDVTSTQRSELLQRICLFDDCDWAQFLSDNQKQVTWRIGHACTVGGDADALCQSIASEPEVESAEIETPRRLG